MTVWRLVAKAVHSAYMSHPRVANSVTGFAAFAAGDIFAQSLIVNEEDTKSLNEAVKFDYSKVVQIGLLGVCINGFILHYWFRLLDRVLGNSMNNMGAVVSKALCDQLFYAPTAIMIFFTFKELQKSREEEAPLVERLQDKVQRDFISTYLADWCLWPGVNLINFRFVPIVFRPTFIACAQLVWQTYMSYSCRSNSNSNTKKDNKAI